MDYNFIGIDEGKQNIFRGSTGAGSIDWITDLAEYPTARALQRISDEKVLVGFDNGYFTIDIHSGRITHTCRKWNGVTAAYRKSDDRTLIVGTNLENGKGITILTLNSKDEVSRIDRRKGRYIRLISPLNNGAYLLCMNRALGETDNALNMRRKFRARGFKHIWKAHRYKDGRTLVSAGYGAFMALYSEDGKLIKTFGKKKDLPAEVNPYFYANFDFTEDGNLLVANWQGHGPDNGQKGRQLLCFDTDYNFIDSWSFSEQISSLQGILVL